jgi:hypothetical protein
MTRVTAPLHLKVSSVSLDGALASARSVFDVLAATSGLAERIIPDFPDFISGVTGSGCADLRFEAGNLFGRETVDMTALGACEVIFHPSDRYVEFVSAIAGDRDVSCNLDVHGWPILSSVSGSTTIAGREDGATVLPESTRPADAAVSA